MKFRNLRNSNMSKIVINGTSYVGNSVCISNGKIIIDGKSAKYEGLKVDIKVEGNINELTIDCCDNINVKGDVGSVKTTSGDVSIVGEIKGSVKSTSGDIECGDVGGDVETTSGDVECFNVEGSVHTVSGDIKHKRRV